ARFARAQKRLSISIGFVPTMGYLHQGHLNLIREAKKHAQYVVCSIYVNPTQFAPGEDLEKYPRDAARDIELLKQEECDAVFFPHTDEMYSDGHSTSIKVNGMTEILEGASRPTHFEGVTTIVGKLFNIVRPDVAVFGQKDAQQAAVILQMTNDLNFDTDIVVLDTARDSDGLALSSRNTYLSAIERSEALALSRGLMAAAKEAQSGTTDAARLKSLALAEIERTGVLKAEYVEVLDFAGYRPVDSIADADRPLIAAAVRVGSVRLIDNMFLK
ncbi:MAG: pantoate--beta-alanine ligase, partial [Ectothiorhodospiraceae bacterium]|nr:pantoate--beta-alanine ligase [Ectothiorhodospiraceae bacterium]